MDLARITRAGVVLPVTVDPRGIDGPKRREVESSHWRTPYRGWHVPMSAGAGPEQRIVEAAAVLPMSGAVTGWAGLRWAGGCYFDGTRRGGRELAPVPLALDNRRLVRSQPGVELCEEFLGPTDVLVLDGLPITVPERSVCRLLRTTRALEDRVRILDMAAFDDLCSPTEVEAYARAHLAGRPRVSRIWEAVPLADENSWSPTESVMRVVWTLSGRPRPLTNVPLFDASGQHLVTPDLLDPVSGVVGEYDGLLHLEDGRRSRDLDREELYRDLGLELVTMVGADLGHQERFVGRLAAAYQRAARRRRTDSWTLTQPDWWVDTSTVGRRRLLSRFEREIWLKRQRPTAGT